MLRKAKRAKTTRRSSVRFNYCIEALEIRRLLTVTWINAAGGSWNTPGNWSTDSIPTNTSNVVISEAAGVQITVSGGAQARAVSVTGATLKISSGTLAVSGTVDNSGVITVSPGAELSVFGALTQATGSSLTLSNGILSSGVGSNLLSNPDFESPSVGSNTTTQPDVWGNWGPTYISTQYAYTGAQSIQMPGNSGSGVNQSFSATPGVSYTLTAYAMTPTTSKLTGAEEGILNLLFFNASNTQVGSDGITVLTSNSATGGPNAGSVGGQGWNFYTTTGVAPAGAVTAYVALQVGPYSGLSGTNGGSVFWDDAQFGPTAATSATVVAASLSNSGAITIGASASVNLTGPFTQTSTGTVTEDLGGSPASLLYGTLNVGGAATFGGALNVALVNAYSPSLSDAFTLMNFGSETGAFSSTTLPSGASYAFQSALGPTYLGISALPTSLTTSVNAATVVGAETTNLLGVNLAFWDDQLTTTQTQSLVEAAGLQIFRFPGGSASDDYHFNVTNSYGSTGNTIPQFAQFIDNVGGLGIVTTDYGSGSPQEAEAELAYLTGSPGDTTVIGNGQEWSDALGEWQTVNWQTVGYWASLRAATPLATDDGYNFLRVGHTAPFTGINYWEIGNEQYGNWETDHYAPDGMGGNSTSPYNYPAAYAQFAATFSAFVKADKSLPSILVGIDSGDPSGATDNNWTKNVLTYGLADGFVPGFISDHSYMYGPGAESDSVLLNDTVSNPASIDDWSTRYADYENTLNSVLGASASSVHVMATEYNSNYGTPGKQMTSLVNGLFVADSVGSLLDSGYGGGLFWDLRNDWGTNGNNSPTLYGWREGGDEGILGASNNYDPPSTGAYIPYPTYFGYQLASEIVRAGGVAVSAVSNYSELAVYSVLEANGHLDLMVINKNPDATFADQFNLSGFTPSGQAQFWQYGEAQDYAQSQSPTGAASLANFSSTLAFNGNSFSYTFPAYSMTVIDLTPATKPTVTTAAAATPNPVTATSTQLSVTAVSNDGNPLTYTWSASGPAAVAYSGSTNGSASANNITATFTKAGQYQFTVTITDSDGLFTTSNVTVNVNQTAANITVNPPSMNVATGGTQQYTATATDQFGNAISSPTFTWSVTGSGNSISNSGLLTLGSTAGPYTVTAAIGSVQGVANVTAIAPATISSFTINDGNAQRSMIDTITIVFTEPVTLASQAILLNQRSPSGGSPTAMSFTLSNPSSDQETYVLNFVGSQYEGNSLPNGIYDLTVQAAQVTNSVGSNLGGGNQTYSFYRYYGDYYGTGSVGFPSLLAVAQDYQMTIGQPNYLWYMDINASGTIGFPDLLAIAQEYNSTLSVNSYGAAVPTVLLNAIPLKPVPLVSTQQYIQTGDESSTPADTQATTLDDLLA